MWIVGHICKRCNDKSPSLEKLFDLLINICNNKFEPDLFLNEALKLISKFLSMKINAFGNKIPEIYKLIYEKEGKIQNKKYILKCIYGSFLYYENKELIFLNFFHTKYNYIMELLDKYFKINDEEINSLAMKAFIYLHEKIIFKEESLNDFFEYIETNDHKNENKKQYFKKVLKDFELSNFINVIFYLSQIDLLKFHNNKIKENSRRKLTHLNIIIYYIEKYKEVINLNEKIIDDIFELLIDCYNFQYPLTSLAFSDGLNIVNNTNLLNKKPKEKEEKELNNLKIIEDEVNQKIILLYKTFIKTIYNISLRKKFLLELFSKLNEVQTYIDKLTEDNSITINDLSILVENGIINKIYTIPQINILLLSLVEISENNPELFELVYNSFQDISNIISFF